MATALPGQQILQAPIPYPLAPPVLAAGHEHSSKGNGKIWAGIIVAVVLAGSYFSSNDKAAPAPATAPAQPPAPAGAPALPGVATAPAAPAQPGFPQPSGAPAQPEGTGGVPAQQSAALQQQSFSGQWKAIYGAVEVTNSSWTNHSSQPMQAAILECDQYAANGTDLSQMRMTLNGPVPAGGTTNFNPFQMGAVNPYMTKVNCGIVDVNPAN